MRQCALMIHLQTTMSQHLSGTWTNVACSCHSCCSKRFFSFRNLDAVAGIDIKLSRKKKRKEKYIKLAINSIYCFIYFQIKAHATTKTKSKQSDQPGWYLRNEQSSEIIQWIVGVVHDRENRRQLSTICCQLCVVEKNRKIINDISVWLKRQRERQRRREWESEIKWMKSNNKNANEITRKGKNFQYIECERDRDKKKKE